MSTSALTLNTRDPSNISLIDKETQTSNVYVEDLMSSDQTPSKPVPTNVNKVCKDDNIKVFEFCEIIKDPEDDSISIVKETFTEEVITSPDGVFFEKPSHNRYKYCREVIQPYCKAFSKACPKYPTSNDKIFKSTSNISNKSKQKSESEKKDIVDSSCDSTKEMDPNKDKSDLDDKTTFENPTQSNVKNEPKRPCPPPINTKKECQHQTPNCEEPKSKCPKYLDEAKLKDYLSTCLSTTITMAKKTSAACLEKCEKVIGIQKPKCGEDKPSYYVLKKPKSETTTKKSSFDDLLQSETVENIKTAVQDLAGTVYNKTKETVNIIKSESCKHLGLDKGSKTKVVENKNSGKIASILSKGIKSKTNDTDSNVTGTSSLEKVVEPVIAVIEKVGSVVSSTASIVQNSLQVIEDTCESKLDKSSPYDDPNINRNPPPPKQISHEYEPSENPSMFTMLKTKFFSMFSDKTEDEQQDDDDEDEEIAEKLFDKYCDQ